MIRVPYITGTRTVYNRYAYGMRIVYNRYAYDTRIVYNRYAYDTRVVLTGTCHMLIDTIIWVYPMHLIRVYSVYKAYIGARCIKKILLGYI